MKDSPIILSAPEVRSILAGGTQIRRVVKPQPVIDGAMVTWRGGKALLKAGYMEEVYSSNARLVARAIELCCPWHVGQRLWVRETWQCAVVTGEFKGIGYKASYDFSTWFKDLYHLTTETEPWHELWGKYQDKWRSSTTMPRWASRITLEIIAIRVERLNDISEEDAKAEGVEPSGNHDWDGWPKTHVIGYSKLWDSIYAARYPWSSNPWVWVITFRKV